MAALKESSKYIFEGCGRCVSHLIKALEDPSSSVNSAPVHSCLSAGPAVLGQAEHAPAKACHESFHQKLVISWQGLHHGCRTILFNETGRAAGTANAKAVLVRILSIAYALGLRRPAAE